MPYPTREQFMNLSEKEARAAVWDILARIHTVVVKIADDANIQSINQESEGGPGHYPVYGGNCADRLAGDNYTE
jgi:hypothetical protein